MFSELAYSTRHRILCRVEFASRLHCERLGLFGG
jgi:hypothetical protein